MSNELRSALSNGHLQLYYQPIVSTTTYDMTKVEALLRWKHPDHGMISPAEFIAIAEESNLIHEIGEWVFHEATTQANKWRKIYDPDFQISINTSPKQFKSTVLCNNWLNYLETINLPGKNVIIEITESLLMTSETKITDQLLKLRDAGVQIAIDDFGTGYSSLSYLDKFDIDYLKIDKSFIDGIKADSSDYVLSEAIIVMAHKLGLEVIAEGVETDTQRKLLANINCDYNQGYLFSKPLPASEFESLLLQNRPAASQIIG